jgi:hypothetical protein
MLIEIVWYGYALEDDMIEIKISLFMWYRTPLKYTFKAKGSIKLPTSIKNQIPNRNIFYPFFRKLIF